jgi:branched-chain amino acid transport system substrate-binding protein
MKMHLLSAVLAASMVSPAFAADKIKVGFITTMSGPGGIVGKHEKDGADLALEQLDGKLGGVPAEIVYGDDQLKPDVGRQLADSMINRDKVNFMTGLTYSNVMLAAYPLVVASKTVFVGLGGPSEIAGKMCSPFFYSVAWQNDQLAEAMGHYLTDIGMDDVYLMAPNYTAGKDNLAGLKRTFKGKIAAEIYTNLNQPDYQAELSQIRADNPKAVFVFYPGGLGIQFVKQYVQAGLQGKIPLYSVFTQNELTLPAIGEAAEGDYETGMYSPNLQNPTNVAFVKAFTEKYGYTPSEYAAISYDAIKLMDVATKSVGGNVEDAQAVLAAIAKADVMSVRGKKLAFNTNHFPIQDFYLFKVAKGPNGKMTPAVEKVVMPDAKDSYASECPMK